MSFLWFHVYVRSISTLSWLSYTKILLAGPGGHIFIQETCDINDNLMPIHFDIRESGGLALISLSFIIASSQKTNASSNIYIDLLQMFSCCIPHTHTHTHTHTCACTHTHTHIHTHAYTCTHTHSCIDMHICRESRVTTFASQLMVKPQVPVRK